MYIINLDPWHPPSVPILNSVNHFQKVVTIHLRRYITPPTSKISILQFLSASVRVETSAPMVKHRSEYQGCLCCVQWSPPAWWEVSQSRDTAETSENNMGDLLSLLSLYSFLTCQSSPQCRLNFLDASASPAIFLSLRVKSFSCCFLNGCTMYKMVQKHRYLYLVLTILLLILL